MVKHSRSNKQTNIKTKLKSKQINNRGKAINYQINTLKHTNINLYEKYMPSRCKRLRMHWNIGAFNIHQLFKYTHFRTVNLIEMNFFRCI